VSTGVVVAASTRRPDRRSPRIRAAGGRSSQRGVTDTVAATVVRMQICAVEMTVMTEPATITATPPPIDEERIRVRAYELYEKRSGDTGDGENDWYRAEAEIKSEVVVPAK